jgi:hypothetical protein
MFIYKANEILLVHNRVGEYMSFVNWSKVNKDNYRFIVSTCNLIFELKSVYITFLNNKI